ncbi:Ger(x)C family spore germination protein [Lentibacillus sp. L22]|uniref:Ger(x)C family spore germination protein n=1 Tax=Lentibacillus TaxID=175304 RepID=UPI0022B129FE|nr:Ger(x)C family spore germination protein [Lentibacillus daqui]
MRRPVMVLPLFIALTLMLAGCWDTTDIEDRGFIVGSGIDLGGTENGGDGITLTHQFVVPAGIGTPTDGGGDTQAFDNLTSSGESMFDISRQMTEKTSKNPFYEHEKVIVISDKVAEQPYLFGKVMDMFLRNSEMRRNIKVVIANGQASKVLDTKPQSEKIPIIYLDDILENSVANITEIQPIVNGDVQDKLLNKLSYILPLVTPKKKSIESMGAAVFNGYNNQMIGVLNGLETEGLNLITGNGKEGNIKIAIHQKNIAYELKDVKSKIKLNVDDIKHMHVQVNIDTSGDISETFGTQNLFQGGSLSEIEKQVSREIKRIAEQTINTAQMDLKTDVFDIGKMLKEHHYNLWQQIKDDWDHGENYFSDVTFDVNVTSRINATGNVNKTKK